MSAGEPFELDEYEDRLTRVRQRMSSAGVDVLLVTLPENLFYLHGYSSDWYQTNSPRSWIATSGTAIHAERGELIHFERRGDAGLMEKTSICTDIRFFPIDNRSFQPDTAGGQVGAVHNRIEFVVDELRAENWLPATVGLEFWSYRPPRAVSDMMEAAFSSAGCKVVDASDAVSGARLVKSAAEIVCIEEAARIADIGILAARDIVQPGMTELELYGEVVRAMTSAGGEISALIQTTQSGPAAQPHGLASRRRIERGDRVAVDLCGVYNRYHGNVVRDIWLGEPPKDVMEMDRRCAGAFEVLCSTSHGTPVAEVNRRLREYYSEVGLWTGEFDRWLGGYELGISFPPDWVGSFYFSVYEKEPDGLFVQNMITNYESHLQLAGQIDTIAYEANGARTLSGLPMELIVLD